MVVRSQRFHVIGGSLSAHVRRFAFRIKPHRLRSMRVPAPCAYPRGTSRLLVCQPVLFPVPSCHGDRPNVRRTRPRRRLY
jgi:hypothetical protein